MKRLMDLVRAAFRSDDLPVVVGRISYAKKEEPAWIHGEVIRAAQANFAKSDSNAAIVTTTDNYGYSDPWHYDSKGYIDLGKQFATEMVKLESKQSRYHPCHVRDL